MNNKVKNMVSKLIFWKTFSDDILEENELDSFFKSLFVNAGSEKELILELTKTKKINHFLFYTNVKNASNILRHGIRPVKELKLKTNEEFVVWDYHQRQESINLDFDVSSRAHFWKWLSDQTINDNEFMVIGIDPEKLAKSSKNDWIFNRAYGMINVVEAIKVEDINWILIRDEEYFDLIKTIIKDEELQIKIYISHDGMVRTGEL
ncbi:hypothetical protein [Mesoplasma corruscae]|uniref:Uncharacterized protein n=1 Tax=Mesoplasma corruscae TaxID=216874 RepID=A0A2S5RFV8_9MOLU|nr:hypothetical protein [Mesoplasma corruscae]PPE06193.1 hypothetical protein MCORR_v1c04970 [Mesoplasma corruscae]